MVSPTSPEETPSGETPKTDLPQQSVSSGRRWSTDFGKGRKLPSPPSSPDLSDDELPPIMRSARVLELEGLEEQEDSSVENLNKAYKNFKEKPNDPETVKQWDREIQQLYSSFSGKASPAVELVAHLLKNCLDNLECDDPDLAWEQAFQILDAHLEKIEKISPLRMADKLQVLKRFEKTETTKLFKAAEFKNNLYLKLFFLNQTQNSAIFSQYCLYISKIEKPSKSSLELMATINGRSQKAIIRIMVNKKITNNTRDYYESVVKQIFPFSPQELTNLLISKFSDFTLSKTNLEYLQDWNDKDLTIYFVNLFVENVKKHPEVYLPFKKIVNEMSPEFVSSFNQALRENPEWSNLRSEILIFYGEVNEVVQMDENFFQLFPPVKPLLIHYSARFQDRSDLPLGGGINQSIGPEIEFQGLEDVLKDPNVELTPEKRQFAILMKEKFKEAGSLLLLNFFALKNNKESAEYVEQRIKNLKEIPKDMLILSLGTSKHALIVCFFKTADSPNLKMVITNTGLGIEKHAKKPATKLYTLNEEFVDISPQNSTDPPWKEKLEKLFALYTDTSGTVDDQINHLYHEIEGLVGQKMETRKREDFTKWYPFKQMQYGGNCTMQCVRQFTKYMMARMSWESLKSKEPSKTLGRGDFWHAYWESETLLSYIDSAITKQIPGVETLKDLKRLKKGTAVFNEQAKEANIGKAEDELNRLARATDVYPFPDHLASKTKAWHLKNKCKYLVNRWQELGYNPDKVNQLIGGAKNPITAIAILRFKYKYNALLKVKELFIHLAKQERDFTSIESNFIANTLNQWPDKTVEDVGIDLLSPKINSKNFFNKNFQEIFNQLKGDRPYLLFSPIIVHMMNSDPLYDSKKPSCIIDLVLARSSPDDIQILKELIEIKDDKLENIFKKLISEFKPPDDYPINKQRFLFLLSLRLERSQTNKKPLTVEEQEVLHAFLLVLERPEKEKLLAPFVQEASSKAQKSGKSWFTMKDSEKDVYIEALFKEQAA